MSHIFKTSDFKNLSRSSRTNQFSIFFQLREKRFTPSDVQNASLAGGVIVGAVANMMLTPFGALIAGGLAGLLSTFGYQVLQVRSIIKAKMFHPLSFRLVFVSG